MQQTSVHEMASLNTAAYNVMHSVQSLIHVYLSLHITIKLHLCYFIPSSKTTFSTNPSHYSLPATTGCILLNGFHIFFYLILQYYKVSIQIQQFPCDSTTSNWLTALNHKCKSIQLHSKLSRKHHVNTIICTCFFHLYRLAQFSSLHRLWSRSLTQLGDHYVMHRLL